MKKFFTILLIFGLVITVNAQFKDDINKKSNIREGFLDPAMSNNIFGFIDPSKFSMDHSVEMSYTTFSGQAVALGVYTNSMRYDFSQKFNLQVDASIVNSPYNTFGDNFANSINGIYLSRAAVNFRPSDKTKISVEFRQGPGTYYNNYYYNPFYFVGSSFDRNYEFYRTHK